MSETTMHTTNTDTSPLHRVLAWAAMLAAVTVGWTLFVFLRPLGTSLYSTGAYLLTGLAISSGISLLILNTIWRRNMRRDGFTPREVAEVTAPLTLGYAMALGISLLSLIVPLSR